MLRIIFMILCFLAIDYVVSSQPQKARETAQASYVDSRLGNWHNMLYYRCHKRQAVSQAAVGILLAGVVASMNFGAISAEAQTTIHGNQTVNGKTMADNTTAKGNSTSMPTPEGPSPP